MNIHWSTEALLEQEVRFGSEAKLWRLVFDSEGCGCSVDGVPTLWAISVPEADDIRATSNGDEVWIDPRHEVFFDPQLYITYLPEHRSFKLASDGQIYTNRFKLQDHRKASIL